MPLNLDLLPDKPKRAERESKKSVIDFDILPDKPVSRASSINFDLLPDKPAPRKDFVKEVLPRGIEQGLETAKATLENMPFVSGFTPKQITKGQEVLENVIERPAAGLRAVAKEGPEALVKGLKEPEKYPVGTFSEALVNAGMEPISAGALGSLADIGYYFGVPEALGRVITAGKVKLLENTINNINEALKASGETRTGVVNIPKETLDAFAKDKDIGNIADAYLKSKMAKFPRRTNLLSEGEVPPETKDIRTFDVTPKTDIRNISKFTDENKDIILKDYESRYGNIISNDFMKKYYSPVGYTGLNSAEYQSEAGKITKSYFDKLTDQNKDTGKYMVFTTGGTGTGKSTASRAYMKDDNVAAIWDLNLTDLEKNSKLIEDALSKGLKVKIAYILRDPEQAFIDGVVARSTNPQSPDYGRAVSIAEHMLIHEKAKDVFPKLAKKFGDKIEYEIIDNRGPEGTQKPIALDELENIKYNYKAIGKELEQHVRTNPKIPQNIQKSLLSGFVEKGTGAIPQERPAIQEGRGRSVKEVGPQEVNGKLPSQKDISENPKTLFLGRAGQKGALGSSQERSALERIGGQTQQGIGSQEVTPEGSFTPSSSIAGFPKASKVPEAVPSAQEHAIEMPELVKLSKDLMGKIPVVKKLMRNYGYFKAGKIIALDIDIFKNPYFAGSVLAHEIGHLIDWLPTSTLSRGNLLGRVLTLRRYMRETFEDLSNKEIRDELKALTQWWNPFDDTTKASYTRYRYSAKELYAEALSVLLNQPEILEKQAPKFYKAFWDNIDKKPDVKEALLELQSFLNLGETEKLRIRKEDIQSMFKKGEALFYEERNKYKLARKDLWFKLRTELIDKNTAILDKIKELEKKGVKVNPEDNPQYYLEEYNYIGGKIKNLLDNISHDVIKPLDKLGISSEDFGEYLFLNRVITDRADIANPLGHNRITAEKQLNYLKETLGDEKFVALKRAAGRFQQVMNELLMRSESSGLIKSDIYGAVVTNPSYATFQVLDYIDDYVSPAIIKQVGTLKEIANPFTSTVIKMISTLRAIERNETRKAVAKFMRKHFPAEIMDAEIRHLGKYKSEIVEKEGYGVIQTREHGKVAGYYVDPYIAQTLTNESSVTANGIVSMLRFLNSGYFRPVYINLNLGFQTFNLMRDFIRAWKLNPNVTFPGMLKKYWDAIPIAKRRVWGDFSDPVISQMQEEGMLSITYNDLLRGMDKEEQSHIDYLLERYNVIKGAPRQQRTMLGKAFNPVLKFLNFIEELGNFVETLPKVTGYLSRAKYGSNIKEIAHEVRVFSGSPDFFRKGQGYDWYNNVFLFSNAIKEGIRGDIEGGFTNPKTRSGYWWRTAKLNLLPKLVMFLASIGYFGQRIKENFDKQTEYDKTNYVTLPLGITENGKAVYFRVPQDEMGRMFGGILWKMLNFQKEDIVNSVQDIGSLMAGQVPSLAPAVELVSSWSQYALGKNPYDWFKGRNILSDDEMMAGGWYSLKPMLEWTSGKAGFTVRAKRGDESPFELVIQHTPAVQRFLRVTDHGSIEKEKEDRREYEQFKASRTLERRR